MFTKCSRAFATCAASGYIVEKVFEGYQADHIRCLSLYLELKQRMT